MTAASHLLLRVFLVLAVICWRGNSPQEKGISARVLRKRYRARRRLISLVMLRA